MYGIKDVQKITLTHVGDERGHMVVAEGGKNVPFEFKRLFYIYGTDAQAIRGQHANRDSAFAMFCVVGSCSVTVMDTTGDKQSYRLSKAQEGIYMPKMLWKEMYDFSPDAVLLVLSDCHYDANEYIRDMALYLGERLKNNVL